MAKGDPTTPNHGSGFFPGIYQSALSQSAKDYDSIMGQYKGLADKVSQSPGTKLNFSPISPTFAQYQGAEDPRQLREFADTGGFSEGDKESIRARDVAPIRSIYDSANRNLNRQKALQGGYSPNYGAAAAKMARESSDIISKHTTDVNANIAEMVNRNRLSALPALTQFEQSEAARKNAWEANNANTANQFAMFNAEEPLKYEGFNRESDMSDFNKILESIKGQQSTYGTTPALANTFGNQVLNAANTFGSFPPINNSRGGSGSSGGVGYGGMPAFGYSRPF